VSDGITLEPWTGDDDDDLAGDDDDLTGDGAGEDDELEGNVHELVEVSDADERVVIRNYADVRRHALASGQKVPDLIALAPGNDPYYAPGTPAGIRDRQWFLRLYSELGFEKAWLVDKHTMHLRRMHYVLISQNKPVRRADGKPYRNTEADWEFLQSASKMARYAGMVPMEAISDHRNPGVETHGRHGLPAPSLQAVQSLPEGWPWLYPLVKEPWLAVVDYEAEQGIHQEVWIEKSTMHDILSPLCAGLGAELQVGVGEMSLTSAYWLVERLRKIGKPLRIIYVSDFDPGGLSMPVAVARKAEWILEDLRLHCDVKLYHVALTAQQVKHYQLPRIPLKESEARRDRFEDAFGQGAVELDALEALHPGELARLVRDALQRCHDETLAKRTNERREALDSEMARIRAEVIGRYGWELGCIRQRWHTLVRDITPELEALRLQAAVTWAAMASEMRALAPSLDDERFKLPAPRLPEEEPEGLYDSSRSYMRQIAHYKAHQRRPVERRASVADFVARRCVPDPTCGIPAPGFNASYWLECKERGEEAASARSVTRQMDDLGFPKTRTKHGEVFRGLRWRQDPILGGWA
jgi:hypothetical protein